MHPSSDTNKNNISKNREIYVRASLYGRRTIFTCAKTNNIQNLRFIYCVPPAILRVLAYIYLCIRIELNRFRKQNLNMMEKTLGVPIPPRAI